MNFIFVATGGALGSVFRYILSLILIKSSFPLATFLVNVIGSVIIGMLFGLSFRKNNYANEINLFLKTGFCGGFTTFSTFSLEVLELIEKEKYLIASLYMGTTLFFTILGVYIGKKLGELL